jgi:hypothetical protein
MKVGNIVVNGQGPCPRIIFPVPFEGLFAGKLVFNTFANQNWSAPEERVQSPFKADSEFDIRVRILPGKFQVD